MFDLSDMLIGASILGIGLCSGVIGISVDMFIQKKKKKKRREKNNEEIRLNKRLNNMEEYLDEYPAYDKVYKKGLRLSQIIDEINDIITKEKQIDEVWIQESNENIYIVARMIEKYDSASNRKEIKKIVLNAIKETKNVMKDKLRELNQEKEQEGEKKREEEKQKFEEKLIQIKN